MSKNMSKLSSDARPSPTNTLSDAHPSPKKSESFFIELYRKVKFLEKSMKDHENVLQNDSYALWHQKHRECMPLTSKLLELHVTKVQFLLRIKFLQNSISTSNAEIGSFQEIAEIPDPNSDPIFTPRAFRDCILETIADLEQKLNDQLFQLSQLIHELEKVDTDINIADTEMQNYKKSIRNSGAK